MMCLSSCLPWYILPLLFLLSWQSHRVLISSIDIERSAIISEVYFWSWPRPQAISINVPPLLQGFRADVQWDNSEAGYKIKGNVKEMYRKEKERKGEGKGKGKGKANHIYISWSCPWPEGFCLKHASMSNNLQNLALVPLPTYWSPLQGFYHRLLESKFLCEGVEACLKQHQRIFFSHLGCFTNLLCDNKKNKKCLEATILWMAITWHKKRFW